MSRLARYLSIILLTGGVVLGASISDYSESALNNRAPDLHHVTNYHRSYYDGFVEIGYKYVIKPGHYGWLWMFPIAAATKAGEDAADKGYTKYFDSWNGDYIGDNKQQARRTVASRREERRRIQAEAAARRERLQREAAERERRQRAAAEQERQRQRLIAERERQRRALAAELERQRQREVAERERRQREAAEQERQRQRLIAERERQRRALAAELERQRQREAAERERQRQREAAQRNALLSEGNALLLADKYEEALRKFGQVLRTAPSHKEALEKRNLANDVLEGNKWWEEADKELQAANESRLKRDYSNALAHYHKALAHYRLAVKGFEKASIKDSRFQGKRSQAQAAVTDLEETTTKVKLEAGRAGVHLDINWNVDMSAKEGLIKEEEENVNAEPESHVVVDRARG